MRGRGYGTDIRVIIFCHYDRMTAENSLFDGDGGWMVDEDCDGDGT